MKERTGAITIVFIMSFCLQSLYAQQATENEGYHAWWNEGYRGRPRKNPQAKKLPLIKVDGNKFVDAEGETVLFRGLSISDPDKIENQGHWKKKHFETVKEMGAMIVRIPVHPVAWRELNEDMIFLIRAYDKETIPLVAGFDWAYDLTPLHIDPVRAEGIGYVTHPYSNKRQQPWEPKWDEDFGFAASRYPVVATEFGFRLRKGQEVEDEDYPKAIIRYLESNDISWMGWVYDPEWYPRMLESWDTYELTGGGEFFKKAMQGRIGAGARP